MTPLAYHYFHVTLSPGSGFSDSALAPTPGTVFSLGWFSRRVLCSVLGEFTLEI